VESASASKHVVRVTIFQQNYTLRAAADPAETEALARKVDALMQQIADRTAAADSTRVAVLAALHLADKGRQAELHADEADERLREFRIKLQETQARLEAAEQRIRELEQTAAGQQQAGALNRQHANELLERLSALDARLTEILEAPDTNPPF
jgi:cell division protein ZapA (FtsZ GTPase activity inhibitor)